jgi:hypothetical protein
MMSRLTDMLAARRRAREQQIDRPRRAAGSRTSAIRRIGRTLAASDEAQLRAAIAHMEASIACIQAVLDGNGTEDAVELSWRHAPVN